MLIDHVPVTAQSRSRWPRHLRCGSAAALLLGLRVRIPPEALKSVSCVCCVFSGRNLCDRPITRPEESYRPYCLSVISKPRQRGSIDPLRLSSHEKKNCSTGSCRDFTPFSHVSVTMESSNWI